MKKTIHFKIYPDYQKSVMFFFFLLLGVANIQAQTLILNYSGYEICQGQSISVTATIQTHGTYECTNRTTSVYSFSWKLNGNSIYQTTSPDPTSTYIYNSFPTGSNVITCEAAELYNCLLIFNPGGGGSLITVTSPMTSSIPYANGFGAYVFPNHPNLHILPDPAPGPYVTNNEYSFSIPATTVPYLTYTWSVDPRFGTIKSTNDDNTSIVIHTANAATPTPANPADPIQIMVTSTNAFCSISDNINVASINTPPLQPGVPSVVSFGEDNSVMLSWNVSGSDINVTVANGDNTAVKYYIINYTDVPGGTTGTYTYTVTPSDLSKKTLRVTVPNLLEQTKTNLHAYTFSAIAQDDYELNSTSSQTSSPAYIIDHTAPDVPTMVTFIEQTDNTVTLTWNASADNVATTGYNIYRNTVKVATVGAVNVYTAALGTLPANFTVDAFDANGYKSGVSNPGIDVTHQVDPFVIDPATGFVGIGVNPPSEKLDVDGNLKVRGDIIMDKFDKTKPDVITFTGTSLDIYTPSQAQYNGHQPIISMTQWGEIKFNSTPYLNYNDIKFLGTGNYVNGIGYRDAFGGVTGIGGPVLFGEKGGALGSKQGSWNGPEQLAIKWDQQSNVSVTGALYMPALPQGTRPVEDPWITQGFTSNNPSYPSYQSELTLRQYWKTKVTANTPQFFVTGEINAVGGYRVAGRDIHSGNPDVVNNAPYYGIGMSNKILSGTIAAVQVAGYGGIILTDNTGVAVAVHDGNVGIGTQTPQAKLHISGSMRLQDANRATYSVYDNSGGNLGYSLRTQGGGGWAWQFVDGGNTQYFNVDYPSGNVTTKGLLNAQGGLQINGSAVVSSQWSNILGGSGIAYNATGVIGQTVCIGTTDPGEVSYNFSNVKLNVAGSLIVKESILLGSSSQRLAYGQSFISTSSSNDILFYTNTAQVFSIRNDGNVLVSNDLNISGNTLATGNLIIGSAPTSVTDYRLAVDGRIYAKRVTVPSHWADYVFDKEYKLMEVDKLEEYIKVNKRLPGIPSAKEIEKNGLDTGEMIKMQMEKIEELTRYMLQQQKELEGLRKELKAISK